MQKCEKSVHKSAFLGMSISLDNHSLGYNNGINIGDVGYDLLWLVLLLLIMTTID